MVTDVAGDEELIKKERTKERNAVIGSFEQLVDL